MKWCKYFVVSVLMFFAKPASSQCKTYQLDAKHDTLNCTDFNNEKQGRWYIKVQSLRGEPGYQEGGFYRDDKKEGAWTRSNLIGDVLAEENYKWGYKNGVCRYYTLMGLVREESWKAIDPIHPYDTVRVYHLDNSDKYDLRVVKVESSTVKHGTWNYYDPERETIIKSEEYVIDQLVSGKKISLLAISDSLNTAQNNQTDTLLLRNKAKPAEVLQYEKKNSNKKKIKVRDGATGVD